MPARVWACRSRKCGELGDAVRVAGQGQDGVFGQVPAVERVHAFLGVADRHRGEGIAVVAALEGEEAAAGAHALVEPVLGGHFHGDFDGDGAAVGEEDVVQVAGEQGGEAGGQVFGGRVGEAAEHDVRHLGELSGDGFADVRMIIAVAGGPPGGDAVDQLASVFEGDGAALGGGGAERWGGGAHLGVRAPEVPVH